MCGELHKYIPLQMELQMSKYRVGFNDDGILITEEVEANDVELAKSLAQEIHPDLPIIFAKLIK